MEKEIWIMVFLNDGYYKNVEKVFDTEEDANQYALDIGYVLHKRKDTSGFGVVRYRKENSPENQLVLEHEVVFVR